MQVIKHGTGAKQSPPDERDFPLARLAAASPNMVAVRKLPATFVVVKRPPILDQGDTPQCVAFSSASVKGYQDHKDQGTFFSFDTGYFFRVIGGTDDGAIVRNALDRMLKVGYPVVSDVQGTDAAIHKIAAYYAVPKNVEDIKHAVHSFGELVMAVPWYNSWFEPNKKGILPPADYEIGGHAIVIDGWDDARGLRLRNSWGKSWGINGDCYLPYPFVSVIWEVWKTVDVINRPASGAV